MLTGLASNTNIVIIAERIAESALAVMAKSLESSSVTINNEHGNDWDDKFGEVTRLWVNESHESTMEAELDPDHYRTKTLIEAPDKGKKLRLSIGGMVKQAGRFIAIELKRPPPPSTNRSIFSKPGPGIAGWQVMPPVWTVRGIFSMGYRLMLTIGTSDSTCDHSHCDTVAVSRQVPRANCGRPLSIVLSVRKLRCRRKITSSENHSPSKR